MSTKPPPLPKTMRGILVSSTGGPEVLTYIPNLPVPHPKANEVLVRNTVIGINYIDTYFRTGLYASSKPEILGREGVGEVVALGSGGDDDDDNDKDGDGDDGRFGGGGLKVGDRVVWMGTGGYAEFTAAPVEKTMRVPDGVSSEDACAAMIQGLTAVTLVEEAHKVERGQWVLVLAATGGVG